MRPPRTLFLACLLGSLLVTLPAGAASADDALWPRPVIVPEPESVAGVAQPVISLAGIWKVTATPPADFWSNSVDPAEWMDIRVPAQATRMGLPRGTRRYAYRTQFHLPADFDEQRIYLRFEGVTGTARVWVNGAEIDGHHGGFTVWNRDITELVTAGEDAWLTVSVEEPTKETSTNTYRGGIIRDVKLLALPANHVTRFHTDTDLDEHFRDATLRIWTAASLQRSVSAKVELTLTAPDGSRRRPAAPPPEVPAAAPEIRNQPQRIVVAGRDFALAFNRQTKQLERGEFRGQRLLTGGPALNLLGADLQPWTGTGLSAVKEGDSVVVHIGGNYGPVAVRFELRIDGHGRIATRYTLDDFPLDIPQTTVVPWNRTNAGGFGEVGITYTLTSDIDRLAWKREGLWSAYPADHIGRNEGVAFRSGPGVAAQPGVEPRWPYAYDEKDFNLFGPDDAGGRGTEDFRSMKEYIREAWIYAFESDAALLVESDATDAVRLEVAGAGPDGKVRLLINNGWNYRNLGLGNYMKRPVIVGEGYTNEVRMQFATAPAP